MAVEHYIQLTRMIERMHRRFLDVLRKELIAEGVRDINGVQYLMLANIGDDEVMVRELVERGYYLGSNVTYNLKKLADFGYIDQRGSDLDKRVILVRVTRKGKDLIARLRNREMAHASALAELLPGNTASDGITALRSLERVWGEVLEPAVRAA